MTHTSYYTSEDVGATTWSVYAEDYTHPDADEPIDGSQRLVEAGLPNEGAADARANALTSAVL